MKLYYFTFPCNRQVLLLVSSTKYKFGAQFKIQPGKQAMQLFIISASSGEAPAPPGQLRRPTSTNESCFTPLQSRSMHCTLGITSYFCSLEKRQEMGLKAASGFSCPTALRLFFSTSTAWVSHSASANRRRCCVQYLSLPL